MKKIWTALRGKFQQLSPERRAVLTRWLVTLALVLVTIGLYLPVRHHEFINYDDNIFVIENLNIKQGITERSVRWCLTAGLLEADDHADYWRPLSYLSHALDIEWFGFEPGPHHLTSLIFHVAGTVVLFLVLTSMTGALWRSAFVAAVFAWHPLHVESVAWIAERKDVLCGIFFFLTLGAYAGWVRHGFSWWRYGLVIVSFLLALMSKPTAVTLPFLLLLLDYWPLNRFSLPWGKWQSGLPPILSLRLAMRLIAEKLPLLLLTGLASLSTFVVQKDLGAVADLPFSTRLGNTLVSYASYLGKTLWPRDLAVYYPYDYSLPATRIAAAAVVVGALTLAAIVLAKKWRWLPVGWFWFLGTLVPNIGLIHAGSAAMADRYTYLSMSGLAILAAWSVPEMLRSMAHRRVILASASVIVLGTYLAFASRQISFWKDDDTLFQHSTSLTGPTAVAHLALGLSCRRAGKLDEAIYHFSETIRLEPSWGEALTNLGNVYQLQGKLEEAKNHYEDAILIRPKLWASKSNLGNIYRLQKKPEKAVEVFQQCLREHPGIPVVLSNLGNAYLDLNRLEEAVASFQQALVGDPALDAAHFGLGSAYARQNRLVEAAASFREAIRLNPESAENRVKLADVLLKQGRIEEAIAECDTALKMDPKAAEAHYQLGKVLAKRGDLAGAVERYRQAVAISPKYPEALNNLGNLLATSGQPEEAIRCYRKALESEPKNVEAHNNLATLLFQQGHFQEAVAEFEETLRLDPNFIPALINLAWLRASSPEAALRDGTKALDLAQRCLKLTGDRNPSALDALAAAFAEAGDYEKAAATAEKAAESAAASNAPALAVPIKEREALYRGRQPYRIIFQSAAPKTPAPGAPADKRDQTR